MYPKTWLLQDRFQIHTTETQMEKYLMNLIHPFPKVLYTIKIQYYLYTKHTKNWKMLGNRKRTLRNLLFAVCRIG